MTIIFRQFLQIWGWEKKITHNKRFKADKPVCGKTDCYGVCTGVVMVAYRHAEFISASVLCSGEIPKRVRNDTGNQTFQSSP